MHSDFSLNKIARSKRSVFDIISTVSDTTLVQYSTVFDDVFNTVFDIEAIMDKTIRSSIVVVSHIQHIGCQPEKPTLHGGQSIPLVIFYTV